MIYIILAGICWYGVGVFGFIYWWTSEYDLDTTEFAMALIIGIIGPLAFLFGWMIHSSGKSWIKQRKL